MNKINEKQLTLYEQDPDKNREGIKAMYQQLWDEWEKEYQKHQPFITPRMTKEQFCQKCEREIKRSKMLTRITNLHTEVGRIEHEEWLQKKRDEDQQFVRDLKRRLQPKPHPNPKFKPQRRRVVISNNVNTLIQAAEQYENELYLKRFLVMGKA